MSPVLIWYIANSINSSKISTAGRSSAGQLFQSSFKLSFSVDKRCTITLLLKPSSSDTKSDILFIFTIAIMKKVLMVLLYLPFVRYSNISSIPSLIHFLPATSCNIPDNLIFSDFLNARSILS